MSSPAVIFEEGFRVPAEAHDLAGFRGWAQSPEFPEAGRIDFLGGDVEVEMSPEDLQTHGALKAELAAVLHERITRANLGQVFVDRSRVSSPAGGLSVEPDVVVVLWDSLEAGRVRYVPAAGGKAGRFREIEGAPDLVVEIVSDASVSKDTRRLPGRYAAAGIPELWLVDARGDELSFEVFSLDAAAYRRVSPAPDGRTPSPVLGLRLRLTREPTRFDTWRYRLDAAAE